MTQAEMLHQMCFDNLSNADVKAISQIRGFSAAESASRALFESFFLSDIGVAAAMRTLSRPEVVLLYLLHSRSTPVDLAFFSRIYPDSGLRYGSFTQRYQPVLQAVRTGLIRRGLLVMAESGNESDGASKMERWRFYFPQQFAHHLPPLVEETISLETPGTVNQTNVRQKVLTLLQQKRFGLWAANLPAYEMAIVQGELKMGESRFQVAGLHAWQQACWEAATSKIQGKQESAAVKTASELSPVAAARYGFGQLPLNAWIVPSQLTSILQVFCADPNMQADSLCVAGWEWGCLARQTVSNRDYYRLPVESGAATTEQVGAALTLVGDQIRVDLTTIDYEDLEVLAQISTWQIEKGQVLVVPDLIKLGKLEPALRSHPLLNWLQSNMPTFAQALRTVARRWGKQIVHENLLIAKINDLSLKVIIQRALAAEEQLLLLPNDFIAFPRALLPTIDKLVKQSGYVIKQVTPTTK